MSSLTRLGISLAGLFGDLPVDYTHILFANITHLEIFDQAAGQIAEGLALIRNLTHCAFNCDLLLKRAPHILQTCPKLQYLIFIIVSAVYFKVHETDDQYASLAEDPRFVVAVRGHFHEDWLSGAKAGHDFRARAEAFVGLKRVGKTDRKFQWYNKSVRLIPSELGLKCICHETPL
jgi:hypothetical protein